MNKRVISKGNIKRFTDQCFDRESEQASRIIKGVLEAQSPRISDIANAMDGNYEGNYKAIQRFIEDTRQRKPCIVSMMRNQDMCWVIPQI